jgi:hypothetical protein
MARGGRQAADGELLALSSASHLQCSSHRLVISLADTCTLRPGSARPTTGRAAALVAICRDTTHDHAQKPAPSARLSFRSGCRMPLCTKQRTRNEKPSTMVLRWHFCCPVDGACSQSTPNHHPLADIFWRLGQRKGLARGNEWANLRRQRIHGCKPSSRPSKPTSAPRNPRKSTRADDGGIVETVEPNQLQL